MSRCTSSLSSIACQSQGTPGKRATTFRCPPSTSTPIKSSPIRSGHTNIVREIRARVNKEHHHWITARQIEGMSGTDRTLCTTGDILNNKGGRADSPPFWRAPVLMHSYRTLYGLLTRELESGKVGLAPPPWLGGVRVVSLVFGEWAADTRPRSVRLDDPLLVDAGWTDTAFPSFFEQLTGATVHLKLNTKRNNPRARVTCAPRASCARL